MALLLPRINEQGDHAVLGYELGQQLESLGVKFALNEADSREVSVRPGETGDEACLDRVATDEDNRDRRGCIFRRQCRSDAACHDHVDLAAGEIDRKCG